MTFKCNTIHNILTFEKCSIPLGLFASFSQNGAHPVRALLPAFPRMAFIPTGLFCQLYPNPQSSLAGSLRPNLAILFSLNGTGLLNKEWFRGILVSF